MRRDAAEVCVAADVLERKLQVEAGMTDAELDEIREINAHLPFAHRIARADAR